MWLKLALGVTIFECCIHFSLAGGVIALPLVVTWRKCRMKRQQSRDIWKIRVLTFMVVYTKPRCVCVVFIRTHWPAPPRLSCIQNPVTSLWLASLGLEMVTATISHQTDSRREDCQLGVDHKWTLWFGVWCLRRPAGVQRLVGVPWSSFKTQTRTLSSSTCQLFFPQG